MKKNALKGSILLFTAALFWGSSFVAQEQTVGKLGPFSVNFMRFLIGAVLIIPVILIFDRIKIKKLMTKEELYASKKKGFLGGIIIGVLLAIAANLQMVGISLGTNAGKSGFLTAFYMVLVPIISIFLKKRAGLNVWVAVVIAMFGIYFLSVDGEFSVNLGDTLTILCALAFAVEIIVVDKVSVGVDGVFVSFVQLLVAGVVSFIFFLFSGENIELAGFLAGFPHVLYIAMFSCVIAYTCQILGQQETPPALASILMSLESVFSAVFGAIILGNVFTVRQFIGAGLMFGAIMLAQFNPFKFKKREKEDGEQKPD